MTGLRRDGQIQDAVRQCFLAIAPEREAELEAFWGQHQLEFSLVADGDCFEMSGGAYRYIRFNHRALRVLWVSSFAAWEAYTCVANAIVEQRGIDTLRLGKLVDIALAIRDSPDPESVSLEDIPPPGTFPDRCTPELRAPAELAVFSLGWALLHEVAHCIFQQEGQSSTGLANSEKQFEELKCDAFATTFILELVAKHAEERGEDLVLVRKKRAIGLFFAMCALALLSYGAWDETPEHPSIKRRIDEILIHVNGDDVDDALLVAALAFVGLGEILPGAESLLFGVLASAET
jgi:hypothetical protein